MGRRKKEPDSVHRANISDAAERLFMQRGIDAVTVDDIAGEAGYSKATLYVYFKNKEEIIHMLVLKSMKLLRDCIHHALSADSGTWERYYGVCRALSRYQEQYPFYFEFAVGEINVDAGHPDCPPVDREIYETGEEINLEISGFLQNAIRTGGVRPDILVEETVFIFWSALSGVIQMAARKRAYLEKAMDIPVQEYLDHAFCTLWRSISAGAENECLRGGLPGEAGSPLSLFLKGGTKV